ncbi:MAG TPA: hypothetical protein VFW81_01855, partial [Thermoanaerobaculia bacterium]|nr:hypothetical protein [Thermoanaerobaculia bacterium]
MGRVKRPARIALVAPTASAARAATSVGASRVPELRLRPFSLSRYASDLEAPLQVVLCPPGRSVEADLAFLREARRIFLWPPPAAEIWSAIAGLRGSHDDPPTATTASPRT